MKRFLLLFCTAVLVCSIMAVPAFAAEVYVAVQDKADVADFVHFDSSIPEGSYTMMLEIPDDESGELICLISDPFVVEYIEDTSDGYSAFCSGPTLLNFPFGDETLSCSVLICTDFDSQHIGKFYSTESSGSFVLVFDSVVTLTPVGSDQPVTGGSPLSGIFDVFGGVGSWIVGQLGTTTSLFWNGQCLTFLGVLSVCVLALAVVLLLVFVIVRFLRFRG